MAKNILKKQLEDIKGSINDTLNIIKKLLNQASSVGDLIESLSEKEELNTEVINKLKSIKQDLHLNINDLIKSLDKLFEEYQEFIDNTL